MIQSQDMSYLYFARFLALPFHLSAVSCAFFKKQSSAIAHFTDDCCHEDCMEIIDAAGLGDGNMFGCL
jgi:hypothetical protein